MVELKFLLRPAGQGIPSFSAGTVEFQDFERRYYSEFSWESELSQLHQAKIFILGAPSDTGAGIRRGAAHGPRALRETWMKSPRFQKLRTSGKLVDLGDVFVNPHLLHDDLLSLSAQKACQEAMYPLAPQDLRSRLPVSVLSQIKYILNCIYQINPKARCILLGGDHSVAWPMSEFLISHYRETLGILQPDAHTDLLPSRLGIPYCFGTWSYHAAQLLLSPSRLVQIGLRQSRYDRNHWEQTIGVKQWWAEEILRRPEKEIFSNIADHFHAQGVTQIYISNDIDGTDEVFAKSTGTPADQGPQPDFYKGLFLYLSKKFEIICGDLVEVAPDLGTSAEKRRTLKTACSYLDLYLKMMI